MRENDMRGWSQGHKPSRRKAISTNALKSNYSRVLCNLRGAQDQCDCNYYQSVCIILYDLEFKMIYTTQLNINLYLTYNAIQYLVIISITIQCHVHIRIIFTCSFEHMCRNALFNAYLITFLDLLNSASYMYMLMCLKLTS